MIGTGRGLMNGTLFYIRCLDNWNNSNVDSTLVKTIFDDGMPYITFTSNLTTKTNVIAFNIYAGKNKEIAAWQEKKNLELKKN